MSLSPRKDVDNRIEQIILADLCVDSQDNHEEATLRAFLICKLCQCIQHTEDTENKMEELLQEFKKSGFTFQHTVCFY